MRTIHSEEVIWAAITATVLFLLLMAFCISYLIIYRRKRHQHRNEITAFKREFEQQLLKSQIEVQEYTFQQIGKELHDNVGQLLSTCRMLLGLTERNMTMPPDTLLTANATLAQAIGELRSLSKSLDKEWLEQFSFTDNLRAEIARINAGDMVQAEFNDFSGMDLKTEEQIILFRIVQEAIQNAIKHARPKRISIQTGRNNDKVQISISDDGAGINDLERSKGLGIANMKHRTKLLGGNIAWNSGPGKGTVVTIILPVKTQIQ